MYFFDSFPEKVDWSPKKVDSLKEDAKILHSFDICKFAIKPIPLTFENYLLYWYTCAGVRIPRLRCGRNVL